MAQGKIIHGARAQVSIGSGDKADIIGIFTNVSYGSTYDIQPAFILGRYSAAELTYTAAEPIGISASGWRVMDGGPYQATGMPQLQELLNAEELVFTIYDRASPNKKLATITNVRHAGFNTSIASRSLEEMSFNFVGLLLSDEFADNQEAEGASVLP